mmetsp:Transcript_16720/g.19348  ORF Transcript_16720/g.19348 Transcript_16720/m.19348 type:complete len:646 (+) Transcript_16720:223-2160(+)
MPKKRKGDAIYDEDPRDDAENADDVSMSQRRKAYVSTLPMPSTPDKINPKNSLISSSPGVRARKSTRQRLYYIEMKELNRRFAKWAEEEEHKLCLKMESGELNASSTPDFYEAQVSMYIRAAEEIKNKHMPGTGDVLTFGANDFGQLGHKERENGDNFEYFPRCVMTLRNRGTIAVACGGLHSISVNSGGQVDSWGCNDDGGLGIPLAETLWIPQHVSGFVPSQYELATGLDDVITWRDVSDKAAAKPGARLSSSVEERIVKVCTGDCHSLCLSRTGRVYFFGAYKDKDGNKPWRDIAPTDDPRKVHPLEKKRRDVAPIGSQDWPIHVWKLDGRVTDIQCGMAFNVAIVSKSENGITTKSCYTWGLGECGEMSRDVTLPLRDTKYIFKANDKPCADYCVDKIESEYLVPRPVLWADSLNKRTVESVACGGWHLLVVSKNVGDGQLTVHGSGLNNYGQLGLDNKKISKEKGQEANCVYRLTEIKSLKGKNIRQMAAGQHHSIVLDKSGKNLYGFGRMDYGQLGIDSSRPKAGSSTFEPTPVHLVPGEPNPVFTKIACGDQTNIALTAGGDVYTWGYGDTGALGHGIEENEDGIQVDCSDEFMPRKLDILKKINKQRASKGKTPMTCKVHNLSSGGQHSALVCSLVE